MANWKAPLRVSSIVTLHEPEAPLANNGLLSRRRHNRYL
jgi:hypothetical protein